MATTQPEQSINPSTPTELITVKSATCKSLSGKSDLTYHIACDSNNEIYFRIAENSGSGFFSVEWIALSDIERAYSETFAAKGIIAYTLEPLFKGKSVNTPAFLLAVLREEGLVRPMPNRRRAHERVSSDEFKEAIYALVDAGVDLNATKKTAKKPLKSTKSS